VELILQLIVWARFSVCRLLNIFVYLCLEKNQ